MKRKKINRRNIEKLITQILVEIGENPNRKGLINTPKRVAKMYTQIFGGYDETKKPRLTAFPNGEDGVEFHGILKDEGYFFSHCEHHMVPFFGEYYFGYIPDKIIIGASKIGRLINYHAAKLQITERLCGVVMKDFMEAIKPKGAILIMPARHLCKEMRGLRMYNSPFEGDVATGCFLENHAGCKDEFLARIKMLK